MKRFEGQTAIVTGSARGIGLGIARRLAQEGASVAMLDIDGPLAAEMAETLSAKNLSEQNPAAERARVAPPVAYACDVADRVAVEGTVARVLERFGRIDVLVNAAGINGVTTALTHELEPEDFDRVMNINLRGGFLCIRAVLPTMLAANYGRIVNISSISGKHGNLRMLAYTTSKAAIIGMTKVIGKEYAETGITCNAVAPALVRTPATESAHSPGRFRQLAALIPMKRTGEVEEIAAVAAFAASPECAFTTGFTFDASGGRAVY
ncbi:MAG: SDR family NAD(P)-dependent oxidoreductase [bacterium]